ncbi:FAD-binding oxidoreductase [Frondihabitans australicus]|uniref:FAD/FMN-containing dehydrogenase n=1 Tax=Frondihabitans australicus TaxID=386892 RepID=A0A495IJH0_9MICO|nr:FAD-binding oxidoreductase [Frondihabitans australicus]RKR75860.1 FAD/FMN-containing dehydrogenase [Frondihabitans australicus]
MPTGITAHDIERLAATIDGDVLVPGDADYTAQSSGYNSAIAHRPALIVVAASAADIQAAVLFATGHDLPVAVMATGHQATTTFDDALLITTSRMASVAINQKEATATVGAGARWGAVVEAAAAVRLAPLNGSSPLVGVVGFTLGGGLSPTMGRSRGWASDHVRRLDVVTASGEMVRATPTENADLFGALLGGKSNFGIVTAMEFDLFPLPTLFGGGLFFAGAHAEAVLHAYARLTASAPAEATTSIALLRLPPLPFVPEFLQGAFVIHVRIAGLGTDVDWQAFVEPLRTAAPVMVDTLAELPYTDFASIHSDPTEGAPFLERTDLLTELSDETISTLLEWAGPDAESPVQFVELRHLGGALANDGGFVSAVGNRDARFAFWIVAIGMPNDLVPAMAYADGFIRSLQPWSTGKTYLNFMASSDVTPELVAAAYGDDAFDRLRTLKRRFDPKNTFRLNHNITPST